MKPLKLSFIRKGPYIKYLEWSGGKGQRVFVRAMKNFKHILTGHEIFLKVLDGPRNIFLCSPLVILIFKLREFEHKMSKLAIKDI